MLKGLLKQFYTNDEGKEHILQFGMETWWITDFQAYYNRKKATTSIECLENCEVLTLSLDDRNHLCQQLHKIEHFFRIRANNGYSALQRRILSLLDKDAKGRYEELISMNPDLIQRVPKSMIASYLGVSRETLSRLQ